MTAEQIAASFEDEAARLILIAAILRDTPATAVIRRVGLFIETPAVRKGLLGDA